NAPKLHLLHAYCTSRAASSSIRSWSISLASMISVMECDVPRWHTRRPETAPRSHGTILVRGGPPRVDRGQTEAAVSRERERDRTQPFEQRGRQVLGCLHDGVVAGPEQAGQVVRSLMVDGDAERRDALQARLRERLARVLEAVAALVAVAVVRLAVREQQHEPAVRDLASNRRRGVTQRRAQARELVRLERRDALGETGIERLAEALELGDPHVAGAVAAEGLDREAHAQR